MVVYKGIIFADLSHDIIYLLIRREHQEGLFNMKVFLLHLARHDNIIVIFVSYQQEFLDKG
jgi:hypothetical protein